MNNKVSIEAMASAASFLGIGDRGQLIDAIRWFQSDLVSNTGSVAEQSNSGQNARPSDDPYNALISTCDLEPTASGALDGTRVVVKDVIFLAGVRCTAGTRLLQHVPMFDAEVVRRLRGAGARIVATTNMDAFGFGGTGTASDFGSVINPAAPGRSSGGSSAGSAAALAYPDVDAALGCDQAGSIRVPAAWCEVLGFKPTTGVVPYTGIIGTDRRLDVVGPLTRDVRTMATIFDQLRSPEPVMFGHAGQAIADAPQNLRDWRVGLWRGALEQSDAVVEDCVLLASVAMKQAGAQIVEVALDHAHLGAEVAAAAFTQPLVMGLLAGTLALDEYGNPYEHFARDLAHTVLPRLDQLPASLRAGLAAGLSTSRWSGGEAYAGSIRLRQLMSSELKTVFEDVDILLMPTTPQLPVLVEDPHGELDASTYGSTMFIFTSLANFTGYPAMTLPLAKAGGLPVGVMAMANFGADDRLIAFAQSVEKTIGWTRADRGVQV